MSLRADPLQRPNLTARSTPPSSATSAREAHRRASDWPGTNARLRAGHFDNLFAGSIGGDVAGIYQGASVRQNSCTKPFCYRSLFPRPPFAGSGKASAVVIARIDSGLIPSAKWNIGNGTPTLGERKRNSTAYGRDILITYRQVSSPQTCLLPCRAPVRLFGTGIGHQRLRLNRGRLIEGGQSGGDQFQRGH
jgi:hypothetical protein